MAQPTERQDVTDEQDVAEALDDDKLSAEYPPERPLGVDEYGVTDREEAIEEPLEERVAREVPDVMPEAADRPVGHLVEPDAGAGPDVDPDAVAAVGEPLDGEFRDTGDIASGDTTLRDVAQERYPDMSAEEAAMHETEPPPMGDGDGYLEDEA